MATILIWVVGLAIVAGAVGPLIGTDESTVDKSNVDAKPGRPLGVGRCPLDDITSGTGGVASTPGS